jgi:hypothetical protein
MTDCDIVVDYIKKKKESRFDLQDIFYRYTLEGIGQIAFGVSLGASRLNSVLTRERRCTVAPAALLLRHLRHLCPSCLTRPN